MSMPEVGPLRVTTGPWIPFGLNTTQTLPKHLMKINHMTHLALQGP